MDTRHRAPVSPGDVVAGKYRVERVLGAGGMGVVVAARHIELEQEVALKFILPEAIAGGAGATPGATGVNGAVERLLREAKAAARLKSEHVARVLDVGWDADRPFIVLELLDGIDLARLRRQEGPIAIADAVEYVLQSCEALVEAHAAGIVHRDLKPQNVFVTRRRNGTPLVKVLDFGIAKAIGPAAVGQMALTDSQAVIGSPLYMAPEQMRSARLADVRTDVWALGVILYELLGGKPPFDGETVTEVCIQVVNEAPASLQSLAPGIDPCLEAAVMTCLAKDPAARFQNVASLAVALEPFARSTQLTAPPARPWRSFEDTIDSRHVDTGREPVAAPVSASADDTGPSTAITVPTGEQLEILRAKEAASDAASAASASRPRSSDVGPSSRGAAQDGPVRASGGRKGGQASARAAALVSTDVTWGEATVDPPRSSKRIPPKGPAFARGVFAGVAVAGVAAIVVARFMTPASSPASAPAEETRLTSSSPASAIPTAPPVAPIASPSAVAPAPAPVPAGPAGSAARVTEPNPSGVSATDRPPAHAPGGLRPEASGPSRISLAPSPRSSLASSSSPAAHAPPPSSASPPLPPPSLPNGAPILR